MSVYKASDFYGETPPPRIIGTECEYNVQFEPLIEKNEDPDSIYDGPDTLNETIEEKKIDPIPLFCNRDTLKQIGLSTTSLWCDEPEDETPVTDYYLSNGGRIYKDVGGLIEYCTPESLGPREAAAADMAGTVIMQKLGVASPVEHRGIYKRTGAIISPSGDGYKAETTGYHENFLVPNSLFEIDGPIGNQTLLQAAMSLFLTTRVWAWNGSVGLSDYELSQKFRGVGCGITKSLNTRTMHGSKPIAISRPSATSDVDINRMTDFGRFEVRLADSTHSTLNKYLSYAATSLVLRLCEHADMVPPLRDLWAEYPVRAAYVSAQDRDFTDLIEIRDDYHLGALDIQEMFVDLFESLDSQIQLPQDESDAIPLLRNLIDDLRKVQRKEEDIALLADRVEWAAKYVYLRKKLGNTALRSTNLEAVQLDLLWDRIDPIGYGMKFTSALERRNKSKQPVSRDMIDHYVYHPPSGTRAYARTKAIASEKNKVRRVEWNSVIVELDRTNGYGMRKTINWSNPYAP
jgi:Pup amidohydrolase